MKIAIICANGKAGQLITKEALNRGLDVTVIVRNQNRTIADKVIIKDLFDITTQDIAPFDVLVDCFGAWTSETLPQYTTSSQYLCDLVSNTNKRLLIVGGAGSLYINKEHTLQLSNSPDFPDVFMPVANACNNALIELRKRNDVNWTYICPAGDFQADGVRTGKYILGGEELVLNSKGESVISYADYAIALVDEIVNGNNIKKRIGVVSE